MPGRELERLVRRRLFELGLTPEGVSRRSGGVIPRETIRGLVRGQRSFRLGDGFAAALARALDVTEYRVRKAAGLPVQEPFVARTRPHLRVVRDPE
jgi:hypothetical protein